MKHIWKLIKWLLYYATKACIICMFLFAVVVQIMWDVIWHLQWPNKKRMMQWYQFIRALPKAVKEVMDELTSEPS